jgi:hypothetical protein
VIGLRHFKNHAGKKTPGYRGFSDGAVYYGKKCMKDDNSGQIDAKLSVALRTARPVSELPPGFEAAVWRRIEKGSVTQGNVLERLARLLVTPRLATALVAVVLLLAASAGAIRGVHKGEREARDRYVASVDPSYSQH